ncbi:MAG: 16S rRNA (cytosine(967)-C(5))-methyltransferase RsmB [Clostridia bacterium]|nr:16S rRNA (cytosine(967)-C(5))-methyltransferase RsmB [Clostridia bacterium]
MNSRETALQILMEFEEGHLYSNLLLNKELKKGNFSEVDKTFITQLVYGVISNRIFLDFVIRKFSKIRLKKIAPPILTTLRMGIYQIYFLSRVPVSAACDESVKLARKYGHNASANFVNAILRNVAKTEKRRILDEIPSLDERLSVEYSYPLWLITLWLKQFGKEETVQLLKKNEEVPYQCLRVNTLKLSREELKERLTADGVEVQEGVVSDILYTNTSKNLLNSSYFEDGLLTFQDEAPALVAHLLEAEDGEEILDICAAPGGKTTHIAELTKDQAKITAMDLYEHRCKLIEELAERLGIHSITTLAQDASIYCPEYEEKFDRIVADVPCSGLGVIRKKPDIKLRVEEGDIEKINEIQKAILRNAARYLKKGGRLLYSTCTNTACENEDTVRWFLEEYKDFEIDTKEEVIPEKFRSGLVNGMLTLSPTHQDTDGFFICSFCKKR